MAYDVSAFPDTVVEEPVLSGNRRPSAAEVLSTNWKRRHKHLFSSWPIIGKHSHCHI